MNRSEPEINWQSLPPLIIVLLLTVGAYWAPWPLEGERPKQEYVGIPQEGIQQVDARLWQDPFAAAQRHHKEEAQRHRKEELPLPLPKDVVQQIKKLVPQKDEEKRDMDWLSKVAGEKCGGREDCLVVGVMVFGGPYVGMEEFRRRTRYAVLAGLNEYGFAPEDSEHIGYVKPGKPHLPTLVPFEWLEKDSQPLLLLWLEEETLVREFPFTENEKQNNVLERLAELLVPLKQEVSSRPIFHLIGPSYSSTLLKMAEDLPKDGKLPPPLDQVRWYSHSATAKKAWEKIDEVNKGQKPLLITRVIAQDDKLVEELIKELTVRGIKEGDTVALVGQWDTAYSRYLVSQWKDELQARQIKTTSPSYLRGIDGRLPGGEANKENKQNKEGKEDQKDKSRVERPEGDPQIDYLRRLTMELARQHKAPQERISAIGILGNDYHDKLLALKALRPAFPEAVFFTTDLDAGMLHSGDNRYTRNLVVASAYDLTLVPELQGGFPPFRGSYQTAAFLATQIALRNAKSPEPALRQSNLDPLLKPLVYEIGRTTAVRLNNPEQKPQCRLLERCDDLHPWRDTTFGRNIPLGVVLALGAGGMLLYRFSRSFRQFVLDHGLGLVVGIILVDAFALWLFIHLPNPLGEPFSWIEGVSVWPTEILRFLAALLALFLFFSRGIHHLRRCDEETHRLFSFDEEAEGRQGERRSWAPDIWRLYRARQISVNQLDYRLGEGRMDDVVPSWKIGHFFRQNFEPVLYYLLLGSGVVLALGFPYAPVRGAGMMWLDKSSMWWLDKSVILLAVFCFALLLFFVLNASRRAIWLAEKLAGETSWPKLTMAYFGKPQDVDAKYFDDWLGVRLIAAATSALVKLVYYPFLVFFLLVFARSSLFDAWHTPLSLYLIFALALLLMILCAWRLRHIAEKARAEALQHMGDYLLEAQGQKGKESLARQLQTMIEQVQAIRIGAFAPISQQPVVRAILTLTGGISGLALLESAILANV